MLSDLASTFTSTGNGLAALFIYRTSDMTLMNTINYGGTLFANGDAILQGLVVGTKLYMAAYSGNKIYVLDIATPDTPTLVKSIPLPTGAAPNALTINPAGTRLYVGSDGAGALYTIDLTNTGTISCTGTIVGCTSLNPTNLTTGSYLGQLVIDSTGNKGYLPNNDKIFVLNTSSISTTVSTTITLSTSYAVGAVLSADESKLYVANASLNYVPVINTSTNAITGMYASPAPFRLSRIGSTLYSLSNTYSVLSPIDLTEPMQSITAPTYSLPAYPNTAVNPNMTYGAAAP